MSAPMLRRSVWGWVYTNNPFYAISTALMIYAIRAAYGSIVIGEINYWIMMGVIAGYTLLLAVIGVVIVRWGKVWEDARSILLLLLLLFLAVSVSTDELFVRTATSSSGTALLACGYLFSAVVSEMVLRGLRIRLGWRYRVPYHLLMALFYMTPWYCAFLSHERLTDSLQWVLFLFPSAAAVLFLSLLPAVRQGPDHVTENGTPWNWPWFPWTAFGVIAAAVGLRSFVLCLTFGPDWPIWSYHIGGRSIVFDTMWGPYFLVPLGLALLVMLMEMGKVTKNDRFLRRLITAAPMLLLLSLPWGNGVAFSNFQQVVVRTVGSPIWLTTCLLLAFYAWAWLRRVSGAIWGAVAMLTVLSVVDPLTINTRTLAEPQFWPFFVIGPMLAIQGLRARSSLICTASAVAFTFGLWLLLPQTILTDFRMLTCYHLLWFAVVAMGLAFRDRFAHILRAVGALQIPLASTALLISDRAAEVPLSWRLLHITLLCVSCLAIARYWRSRWYLYAFAGTLAVGGYGVAVLGFRQAVKSIGLPAMTAFLWSVGALILGVLISAHKADWLPGFPLPHWWNRNKSPEPVFDELPMEADGISPDVSSP